MPARALVRLARRFRPASTRLFAAKLLIWGAAIAVVLVGVQLSGIGAAHHQAAAPAPAASAAKSRSLAAGPFAPLIAAAGPAPSAPASGASSAAYNKLRAVTCPNAAGGVCEYGSGVVEKNGKYYTKAEIQNLDKAIGLLPAWRWGSAVQLYSNTGIGGFLFNAVSDAILPALASACFVIASWIWQLLLAIIAWGLSANIIGALGGSINEAFKGLADNLTNAGLWALIGFGVVLVSLRTLLKGNVTRVLTLVLTFVLPTATMWALASSVGNTKGSGLNAPGTPAWIAATGTNMLQTVSSELTRPISALKGSSSAAAVANNQSSLVPNCAQYDAVLYGYYNSLVNQSGAGGGLTALDDVSYLWQSAFESDWEIAQFGSVANGTRMVCHQLERNANISPQEQQAIAAAAYPGAAPSVQVFTTGTNRKKAEAQTFFWAACAGPGGSMAPRLGWSMNGSGSGESTGGGLAHSDCNTWWQSGSMSGKLQWATGGDLQSATTPPAGASATTTKALGSVYSTVTAYWGWNSAQRLLEGLFALVTSFIYLWTLGGLAIGCVIAEVGCVLMFILLPVTLTALSAGALTGGESRLGKKMLKLTAGFMASKLVFNVVLFALLQIIYLGEALLTTNGSGLDGIMQAVIPIAALFLLRKLLMYVRLGDITKVGGAVGLASAAAVRATGDARLLNATHAGFARAGKIADLSAFGVGKSLGRATGRAARFGARKIDQKTDLSTRLNLAARKTQLLGRTDKDGNVREQGLAQQVAWFGALVNAGARTKALAPLLMSSYEHQAGMAAGEARLRKNARAQISQVRAERREWIAATSGMSREQRAAATARRLAAADATLRVAGSKHNRFEAPGADGKTKLHATPLLEANESYSDRDLASIMKVAAGEYGVEENQVVGSHLGFATLQMPHQGRANGTGRTVGTTRKRGAEQAMDLSKDVLNYMDFDLLRRRDGESMDAWNYRLNHYRLAAGGIDAEGNPTDYLAASGIDLSTAAGKAMWAADQRGEHTPIANVKATLAADVIADIDRRSRELDALGGFSGRGFDASAREQAVTDAVALAHTVSGFAEGARTRVEGAGSTISRTIVEYQQNETKLPELRQRLGNAENVVVTINHDLEQQQSRLVRLQREAASAGERASTFEVEVRSGRSNDRAQLERLVAEAAEKSTAAQKVEVGLADLEARRTSASETRDSLQAQVRRISAEMESAPERLEELRSELFDAAHAAVDQAAEAETEAVKLKLFAEIQRGERSFDEIQYDAVEAEKAIKKKVKQAEDALARQENAILQAEGSDAVKQAIGEMQRYASGLARSASDLVGAEMGRTAKEWKASEAVRAALDARYSHDSTPQTVEDLWGKKALERARFPR